MPQPFLGFWNTLTRPIIGLSPMDGVTDFACRYMTARHGRPDVIFTEFTTAEGLFYAPERILKDFEYSEIERPIVAQIYGHRPEDFYRATHVVCELGFDGVDINMGCPAKSVVQKNCGAKLITAPDLALEILQATRAAIDDWVGGQTLQDLKISERVIREVCRMNESRMGAEKTAHRKPIPFSVKTRIGYDSIVIERWIHTLLQASPAVISIHGRTLKQMYKGSAQWDAIGSAAQSARGTGTFILGNGDLTSLEKAAQAIQGSGVDGVLIGRNAIGNPWVFSQKDLLKEKIRQGGDSLGPIHFPEIVIDRSERIRITLEHSRYFLQGRGEANFKSLRKHLIGYLGYFQDATALRRNALRTTCFEDLSSLLLS